LFRPERDVWYVTGWDVRQFTYCPVIPWLRANYGVEEPPTFSMALGLDVGRDVKELIARKLNLPKPWRFEVRVDDHREGLSGTVDILAGSRWFAVVEVKAFKRRRFEHFTSQLFFYVYLVNKALGPVRESYLVLGDEVVSYVVDEYVLKKASELVRKVREVKASAKPPNPRRGTHCSYCWYRRYCLSFG